MGASLSVSSIYRLIQARKHAHEYSDNGVKEETVATSANEEAPNNRFLLPSTSAQQKNKRVKLIYSLADEEDSSSIHRGHHTFFSSSTSLPVNVPPPRIQRAHSDSQELEVETVNECEQSREEAAHAFLPAHVEKCVSELSVPSNELSRKADNCLREVVLYCKQRRPEVFQLDRPPLRLLALALSQMSLPGLRVSIRKVAHSSKTYWSSPSGSEFIVCVASDGRKSTQTTIVDPSFKENFKTPYPTERYSQMLKLIPGCFIGTPSSLLPLLRIIVFELTLTFRAHNSDLPPWRTMKALSSKWLSDSCSDEAISATAFLKAASKSQQDHAATSPISRQHEIVPNRSWSHMSTEDIRTVSTDPSLSAADDSSLFALSEPSICSEDQAATDSQAIFIVGFHIKQQVHD